MQLRFFFTFLPYASELISDTDIFILKKIMQNLMKVGEFLDLRFRLNIKPSIIRIQKNRIFVSPIFSSICHTGEQLHRFRVEVELRVEAQKPLHEIIGCHVPLSILIQHTGILRKTTQTQLQRLCLIQSVIKCAFVFSSFVGHLV